jgi:allophanate hydrolase subunit 1
MMLMVSYYHYNTTYMQLHRNIQEIIERETKKQQASEVVRRHALPVSCREW